MGLKFYRCNHCGNIFMVMKDGGVNPVCCGESMEKLKANSVDGVGEKHVPVIEKDDEKVTVKVGAVPHPMVPEHHIEWIAVVVGNEILTTNLKPGDKPQATFKLADPKGNITAYAYCNIHGLWISK